MGKDVFEMIRDFGGRGKILGIHFRGVTSPLPSFVETFPDEGYLDLYQVMKALRKVRYSGTVVPDHVPELTGDERDSPRRHGLLHRLHAGPAPPRQRRGRVRVEGGTVRNVGARHAVPRPEFSTSAQVVARAFGR